MSLFSNFQLPRGCCEDIKLCPCIQRLLRALHYYSSSLSKNKEQQNEFINLINETYKITFIIDDLHHLQEKHSHQLYEIKNHALNNFPFSRCNINTCQFANRHYRVNNNNDSKDLPLLKVNMRIHCDIMDSCHCYVFHLSDIGIRMFGDDQVTDGNDNDSNEESKKNEAYDGKFAQIAKTILPTKDASDRFNRISSGNKYNISTAADDTAEVIEYDGITYLDTIFDYLQQLQIEDDVILEVYQFLKYEKYDTESLDLDIKMNGNISQHMINHNNCTDGIIHVFNQSIRMFYFIIYSMSPIFVFNHD